MGGGRLKWGGKFLLQMAKETAGGSNFCLEKNSGRGGFKNDNIFYILGQIEVAMAHSINKDDREKPDRMKTPRCDTFITATLQCFRHAKGTDANEPSNGKKTNPQHNQNRTI